MKHVTTLETSRAITEALEGREVETEYYWELNKVNKYFKGRIVTGNPEDGDNAWAIGVPAYTTDGLLELLPWRIEYGLTGFELCIEKLQFEQYLAVYNRPFSDEYVGESSGKELCEVLGRLLIWLTNNGLMKGEG